MLPQNWDRQITQIVHEHRMLYELQIETATDYEQLRSSLKQRGYTDIPMGVNFLLKMDGYIKAPTANTADIQSTKIMTPKPIL